MNTLTKNNWTSMIISAFVIYGSALAGAAGEFEDKAPGMASPGDTK